jgi:hypothetical protein
MEFCFKTVAVSPFVEEQQNSIYAWSHAMEAYAGIEEQPDGYIVLRGLE